jgi:hypothetical protein
MSAAKVSPGFSPRRGRAGSSIGGSDAGCGEPTMEPLQLSGGVISERLWDDPLLVVRRVGDGLSSTKELAKFFRRRAVAETELAKAMEMTCLTEINLELGGGFAGKIGGNLLGVGANILGAKEKLLGGSRQDMLDSLGESSSSVRNAWASIVYSTKSTANAHNELADTIVEELIHPLEKFCRESEAVYKNFVKEAQKLDRLLSDISDTVAKAQGVYFLSERSSDPDSVSQLRSSVNVVDSGPDRKTAYDEAVAHGNAEQLRLMRDPELSGVLARLEALERERVQLTKDSMHKFVTLTGKKLAHDISAPVATEVMPSIDSINVDADINTFCDKKSSGILIGTMEAREYDSVRDTPPSLKSLAQLNASGGGPIKSGWLHKEGHMVKNWKRRWCVLWPQNFKLEGMAGPSLYYFDDDETGSCPKGTLPIFGSEIGKPKKTRKGYNWLIRIDCAAEEGGKDKDGKKLDKDKDGRKLVVATDSEDEREAWMEALGNASRGESVQRVVTFGAGLPEMVSEQVNPVVNTLLPLGYRCHSGVICLF